MARTGGVDSDPGALEMLSFAGVALPISRVALAIPGNVLLGGMAAAQDWRGTFDATAFADVNVQHPASPSVNAFKPENWVALDANRAFAAHVFLQFHASRPRQ